ncbi:hypothetical protein L366_03252 [Klebsiella variicola]|nr:hypothetical protein L366_03252 [Klebsiella variicola]
MVLVFCGVFLGVRLLMPLTYALLERVIHTYCMNAEINIRDKLFRRLMYAHAESFEKHNIKETLGLFDTSMNAISGYIRTLWSEALPVILQTIFIIGSVWFYTGGSIASIFLFVIVFYAAMILHLTRQRFPLMRNVAVAGNQLKTLLYSLGGVNLQIKYYQAEERSAQRYHQGGLHLIDKQQAIRNVFFRFGIVTAIFSVMGSALVLTFAGNHYLSGKITFGSLIMVTTFLFQVFLPLNHLGVLWRTLNRARIDFRLFEEKMTSLRFYPLLSSIREESIRNATQDMDITFHCLGKSKSGVKIINCLEGNITLKLGQPAFLRGANGAGKTTLLRILSRIDSPDEGRFSCATDNNLLTGDGISPDLISVAPQYVTLLSGTIASNLDLFLGGYNEEQYVQLSSALCFPFTLDDIVEDGGSNMSGGERQKLNIIMALLRKGVFLLLDEPSSGLDKNSISSIGKVLHQHASDRYILIVTHDEQLIKLFPGATIVDILKDKLETFSFTDEKVGQHG